MDSMIAKTFLARKPIATPDGEVIPNCIGEAATAATLKLENFLEKSKEKYETLLASTNIIAWENEACYVLTVLMRRIDNK